MADEKVTRKPQTPVIMRPNVLTGERRIGNQVPTLNVVPHHTSEDRADEAIEFLGLIGVEMDPWQEYLLRSILHLDHRGKWAATEVGMVVPRQSGKTFVAEFRELIGLFVLGEQMQIHSAQLFSTAKESYLRQVARIERVPALKAMIHKCRTGNDNVSIELKNGARLSYQARGNDPSRGFSADLVVYDEAYGLNVDVMSASMSTLSARPNPQLLYCSSTGMEDSDFLLRVRERGIERAPRLAFFEWSADPGCDPRDKEQWYKANPALGIRIEEEFIETEGGALDWGKQFCRERLGMWADTSLKDVIPLEAWQACGDEDSVIVGDELFVAVDVSPFRDAASVAVCGLSGNGRRQIEVIESAKGTNWITGFVQKLMMSSNLPTRVVVQGGGVPGSFIAPLMELGCEMTILGQADIGKGTGEFYEAVMAGRVVHLDDPILETALGNATRYNIGSKEGMEESPAWGFARKDSNGADITSLVACCYAYIGMSKYYAEMAQEEQPHHVGTRHGGRIW